MHPDGSARELVRTWQSLKGQLDRAEGIARLLDDADATLRVIRLLSASLNTNSTAELQALEARAQALVRELEEKLRRRHA